MSQSGSAPLNNKESEQIFLQTVQFPWTVIFWGKIKYFSIEVISKIRQNLAEKRLLMRWKL